MNAQKNNRSNNRVIAILCVLGILIALVGCIMTAPAKAGTAQPLPSTTPEYPIICTDAAGKVTLVADGRKVRVAYWSDEKPYFTDSNRSARHKRTFTAPAGSVCRVGATEANVVLTSSAARG